MKKLSLIVIGCLCALAITVSAAEGGKQKKQLTDEQKTLMKEITKKYDANSDGKLDKEERAKISAEDKEKLKKAGIGGREKKSK